MAAKMADSCGDGPKLGRWKEGRGKAARGGRKWRAKGGGRKGGIGGRGGKVKNGGKFESVESVAAGNLKTTTKILLPGCGLCRPLQSQGGSGVSDEAEQPASKSTRQGSNLRPGDLQSLALPLSYWWLTKRGEKTPNKG